MTQWSADLQEAVYTLGNPPKWAPFPLPAGPTLVASTQSPLGPGSILERCELFVAASATLSGAAALTDEFQVDGLSLIISGEVYPTGSAGLPDPRTGPDKQFAITGAATLRARYFGDGVTCSGGAVWSTGEYVRSEAKRGPATYGGGTPELRLSVYTPNLWNPTWLGIADTSEIYHVRALWKPA